MWLVVGLGNPGSQYRWTPHNLGFEVVHFLINRHTQAPPHGGSGWTTIRQYLALKEFETAVRPTGFVAGSNFWRRRMDGEDVILAKPDTFMNSSGVAVSGLLEKFGLGVRNLIVIFDEVALPWGSIRIRAKGSAGGHNGMKSILRLVGSDEFVRVRIGVKPDHEIGDLAAYVLHPMSRTLRERAATVCDRAAEAIETIVRDGPEIAMTRFNGVSEV